MMMLEPFIQSVVNAGPLAVFATIVGFGVLIKLNRLVDIHLDRYARR